METKKISCAVIGVAGRMGQQICRMLLESEHCTLAGATERSQESCMGKSLKDGLGIQGGDDIVIAENLEEIKNPFDVIIDFTFPDVSMKTVQFAANKKKHGVIGTTGFSQEQMLELTSLSKGFPCVCAPNMSIGVNLLFKLAGDVALILKDDFDAEIMEIHHRFKKDAPSGTALKIAQILADKYGRDLAKAGVYQRKGITGERTKEEIGIQTLRAGDVVGEHTVLFGGIGERLEITHKAQNRNCFVQGALRAAQWIYGKPSGMYDMQDVLGLN